MKASEFLNKGIKRKLIASVCIDLEKAESSFNVPTISWYFNFENLEKPITVTVKCGWVELSEHLPFNDRMKKILEDELLKNSIFYLSEILPTYKGKCEVTNYYRSDFGKDLPFAKISA